MPRLLFQRSLQMPHRELRVITSVRIWLLLLILSLLLRCVPISAQTVEVGVDVGRMYNLTQGDWVQACMPTATLDLGDWSLSTAWFVQRTLYQHNLDLSWAHTRGRLTIMSGVGHSWYRDLGMDWSWSTGMRWRIR